MDVESWMVLVRSNFGFSIHPVIRLSRCRSDAHSLQRSQESFNRLDEEHQGTLSGQEQDREGSDLFDVWIRPSTGTAGRQDRIIDMYSIVKCLVKRT